MAAEKEPHKEEKEEKPKTPDEIKEEERQRLIKLAEKGPLPGSGSKAIGAEVSKPTKEAEEEERAKNKAIAESGEDFRA